MGCVQAARVPLLEEIDRLEQEMKRLEAEKDGVITEKQNEIGVLKARVARSNAKLRLTERTVNQAGIKRERADTSVRTD